MGYYVVICPKNTRSRARFSGIRAKYTVRYRISSTSKALPKPLRRWERGVRAFFVPDPRRHLNACREKAVALSLLPRRLPAAAA